MGVGWGGGGGGGGGKVKYERIPIQQLKHIRNLTKRFIYSMQLV